MKKIVATHNNLMHADEIMAIALLKVFTDYEIEIKRVAHQTKDFSCYDMVIDVSRQFDGVTFFDHHQHKGGKSSAGLIWSYLKQEEKYPKISKLIKLIDDNDVGIKKAEEFEFSTLIQCFNLSKNLISKEQDLQFEKAVDFAQTVVLSMKDKEDGIEIAREIIKNSYLFDNHQHIIKLKKFTPSWSTLINGEITPHIKAVVWEDKEDNSWKVQIPSIKPNSFDLNAKPLTQDDLMTFVHSTGYFAVTKDEKSMKKYLQKQLLL